VLHLLAVSVTNVEEWLAVFGRDGGVDAVGTDLAHPAHDVVFPGAADDASVLGDEVVGLAFGMKAGLGAQNDVEERHRTSSFLADCTTLSVENRR